MPGASFRLFAGLVAALGRSVRLLPLMLFLGCLTLGTGMARPAAAAPTITSITPSKVSTLGTPQLTITGTNLDTVTDVLIDNVAVSAPIKHTGTTVLTVTLPAHPAPGTVDVVIIGPGGSKDTKPGGLTYVAPPTITSITPSVISTGGGTPVIITGTNFDASTTVTVDGTLAQGVTLTKTDGTELSARPQVHAPGLADVVVTNPGGTATMTAGLKYELPPTISAISPAAGPLTGGTPVTITGTNFDTVTSAADVTFRGAPVTAITSLGSNSITVTNPPNNSGTWDVVVSNDDGLSVTRTGGFTYAKTPTVTSISPTSGSTNGGTSVTITGTDLNTVSAVMFGTVAATSFTPVSSTQIRATTPAQAAGPVSISVTTAGGTSTLANAYTYKVLAPTIGSVSPASGSANLTTPVTITGTDFTGVSAVRFGNVQATTFAFVDNTHITATAPAQAAGAVAVSVTANGGTGSKAASFTYVAAPIITSVSPPSGPANATRQVTITGTGFAGVTGVKFGNLAATQVTVVNSTQITATVPAQAAGAVAVSVTTNGGTGMLANAYAYVDAPSISMINPAQGSTNGGDTVTLTGTHLDAVSSVSFDGTAATSLTHQGTTGLTVTTPVHAAGAVAVVVTSPGGVATKAGGFTYVSPPAITAIDPAQGSTNGGDTVTISGTNLDAVTSVTFDGTAGTSLAHQGTTGLTVTTPAHQTAGAVAVAVTSPGGMVMHAIPFTYLDQPTITSITPNAGKTGGDETVKIVGTNFGLPIVAGTVVAFDGTAGTFVSYDSATGTLTEKTPAHQAGAVNVSVTTYGGTATSAGGFTYVGAPTIGTISPKQGSISGGTQVTITGTNLDTITSVTFDGTPGTAVTADSAGTSLTVTTPAFPAPGAVDVKVTTIGGTATGSAGYTYVKSPTITSFTPATGSTSGGTQVTINGTSLAGATVRFGANAGTVVSSSATAITVKTPPVATAGPVTSGPVDVTVTTAGGTVKAGTQFTYTPADLSFTPATLSDAVAGQDYDRTVTMSGGFGAVTYSLESGTLPDGLTFDTAAGRIFGTVATTAATGDYDFTVKGVDALGQTATKPYTIRVKAGPPTISSISPPKGTTNGGTDVTITGTNLVAVTSVTFDGVAGKSLAHQGATGLTVTTPGWSGTALVNVAVISPNGTATKTGGFTYEQYAPTITSVTPPTGSTKGGDLVTITGTDLTGTSGVVIGGIATGSLTNVDNTHIRFTTPAHAAGLVDVSVTAFGRTATLANAFTYQAPLPAITSVTPATGSTSGGTQVTINGTGLAGATVGFGGKGGTVTSNTDTEIRVATPPKEVARFV